MQIDVTLLYYLGSCIIIIMIISEIFNAA